MRGDAIATSSLLQQHPYRINSSEFQRSVIGFLADLHESKAYTDVTLYAQGKLLQAHRIVLAASSGYFKELFSTMDQEQTSSRSARDVKYERSAAVKEEVEEEEQFEDDEEDLLEEETDTLDPSRLLATPLVNMEVLDDSSGNLEEPYDNGLMDEEQSGNVIRMLTRGSDEQNGKPFVCTKCGKTYNSNKSLWRHKKFTCDEKIEFKCSCGKTFSRSDNLRRHVVVAHQNVQ
ncbi:putative zinc finger protein [Orchesella cincta]|uniref:Putative zinc finger protein n=1 Tax=Orchesella cincta TaxID=48709 RepID=A0A1D2MPR3_ORCCI|nr:putative zinc finger protein [Orchesella cincta]